MRYYVAKVSCSTCGKALMKSAVIPEDRLLDAAKAASSRAFCEGHSRNSNLNFDWQAVEAPMAKTEAPTAGDAPAVVIVEVAPPAPPATDDHGIPLSELHRLELEENAIGESVIAVRDTEPSKGPPAANGVVEAAAES